ncbi:hypothetical protein Syun_016179 [Stephania yunnanensis]|uniref:Leucine-rich repeat-containing N-terminal plant-type domain-containing protein n=1 Tax=Stephania yunnanensis TaxID=152371 RepID=A0AAP0J6Y5_9MAGN
MMITKLVKCHSIERLALLDLKKVVVDSTNRLSSGHHLSSKKIIIATYIAYCKWGSQEAFRSSPKILLIRPLRMLKILLFLGPYLQTAKLCSCSDDHKVGNCHSIERLALLDFKKGVEDPSNRISSWRLENEDCCKWHGVGCNNVTGYVEELDLNNIKDMAQATILSGGISPALAQLKHLKYLDLEWQRIPQNIRIGS